MLRSTADREVRTHQTMTLQRTGRGPTRSLRTALVIAILVVALASVALARGGRGGRGGRSRSSRSRSRWGGSRTRVVVINTGGGRSQCRFTDVETNESHIGPCPSDTNTTLIFAICLPLGGVVILGCIIYGCCKKNSSPEDAESLDVSTHSPPTYREYVNEAGPSETPYNL